MTDGKKGLLIVVSGPAGSGKGTVIKELFEKDINKDFVYSVSSTTREPRVGEVNGREYNFVSREEFEHNIKAGQMLEYAVYCENYYGTPKHTVETQLNMGKNVILEIEVQGALQIKEKMPDCIMILITPPNFRTLEKRLRGRGTNTEEDILRRLNRAKEELMLIDKYDYVIQNLDNQSGVAAEEIIKIVECEKLRTFRNSDYLLNFFEENKF